MAHRSFNGSLMAFNGEFVPTELESSLENEGAPSELTVN